MDENRYNKDKNNANDNVAPSGEVVERIQHTNDEGQSILQFITKPGCQHPKRTRKPSNEFDGHDEVTCDDCSLGWFLKVTS
jgi:hypothetical protein